VLQGYKKGLEIEQAVMELFKETYKQALET